MKAADRRKDERPVPVIIPLPVTASPAPGVYELTRGSSIHAAVGTESEAKYLSRQLEQRTGQAVPLANGGAISLSLDDALPELGEEGYALKAGSDGVSIRAARPAGLFFGVQTVLQMMDLELAEGRGPRVPGSVIEDRPRYPWRGFMLDSSRHFQPVETIKRILDQMAYIKLNVLHWHLIDDQAWRLEIKQYPRLTEFGSVRADDEPGGNGFYSQADVRELVEYAAERHITVMPEIEMPAHTAAAMACYPELTCSGQADIQGGMGLQHFITKSGEAPIYCAGRDEVYTFIRNVLDEVMDIFPSPVIHIGGDERPEGPWLRCPRCMAVMKREGLQSESALQAYFMRRVSAFVNARGRRTMAWCPTAEHGIPEKQIAEDWYFDTLTAAVQQGHDAINARDRYTYLDYPNYPDRQKPDWMPELTPERMYEFQPTPAAVQPEQARHVLGSISSLWTEFIEEDDLSAAMFPRLLAFSEVVWTPEARRQWDDFERRMKALEAPLATMGVTYAVPSGSRPVRLVRPAEVTTSMDVDPVYPPECAFDGKYVRCFRSKTAPKAGDHLTVTLAEPAAVTGIRLYTGSGYADGETLPCGALEVSYDGRLFEKIAAVEGKQTDAVVSGGPVKAIRVTVGADLDHRLAITEIVLK